MWIIDPKWIYSDVAVRVLALVWERVYFVRIRGYVFEGGMDVLA